MRESNKYDHYLLRKLRTHAKENPEEAGRLTLPVLVRFNGDIETLRRAGLIVTGNVNGIAIGDIHQPDLEKLEQLDNVIYISTEPPLRAQLDTSIPDIGADVVHAGSPPYTGAGVVIGILDTGIDVFHKNFRKSNGDSRVISIWDQTILPTGTQQPPAGYTRGVEFKPGVIAAALANPNQPFAHQDVIGHGTHVAGIAAGNGTQSGNCHTAGRYLGVAPDADLVIVKVLTDKTSTYFQQSLNEATQYVFQVAEAQSPPKAAVVNMSLVWGLGPRDGTSPEEIYLDGLLSSTTGKAVVVSAGNGGALGYATDINGSYGYRNGTHTTKHINANDHTTVTLMMPPDCKSVETFEIWYSTGAGRLRFGVTGPTGISAGPVNSGDPTTNLSVGPAVVEVTSSINPSNNKGQISVAISPPTGGVLPSGAWTVTLTEVAGTAVDMDLWTHFELGHPNMVVSFPERVVASTLNSPSTAQNVITVGAYATKDGNLAPFSAHGPTLATDGRQKPDICAPGLDENPGAGITAPKAKAEGGCCCDCCYDFYTNFYGTSQAAPHVSGVVALMFQKNGNLAYDKIRSTIQSTARKPTGQTLPNNDWGYGKVDARQAVANTASGSAFAGSTTVATTSSGDLGEGTPTGSLPFTKENKNATAKPFPPIKEVFPASSLRIANALRDIAAQGKDNPALLTLVSLVSLHFEEVRKLINNNPRVATRWHRMFGPEVLRHMLWNKTQNQMEPMPLIPSILNNQQVGERVSALFDVLFRYGSTRLRKDIDLYGPLFVALPGATFSGIFSQSIPETLHGAGRHA